MTSETGILMCFEAFSYEFVISGFYPRENFQASFCTIPHERKKQKCQDVSHFATLEGVDINHVLR